MLTVVFAIKRDRLADVILRLIHRQVARQELSHTLAVEHHAFTLIGLLFAHDIGDHFRCQAVFLIQSPHSYRLGMRGSAVVEFDVLQHIQFGFGNDDMHIYIVFLTVSPTSANSLIKLLVTIRDSAEYHVVAALKVHPESVD